MISYTDTNGSSVPRNPNPSTSHAPGVFTQRAALVHICDGRLQRFVCTQRIGDVVASRAPDQMPPRGILSTLRVFHGPRGLRLLWWIWIWILWIWTRYRLNRSTYFRVSLTVYYRYGPGIGYRSNSFRVSMTLYYGYGYGTEWTDWIRRA